MPNPRYSAAPIRTSRELSERVEQDFHQRGDPFRRLIRWLSVAACVAVVAWIGLAAATGRRTIYEAGPVAPSHQFFENNCQACHTTWAPATRFKFVVGDSSPVHSVDDASCQHCHAGSPHYEGQDPPHDNLGCAACHREHRGDPTLVRGANDQCIECHQALDERLTPLAGSERPEHVTPAVSITSFADDHPEFDALAQPDAARLAFNHRVHLQHEYDKDGKLVKGILNERGVPEDLSKDCTACHQPDAEKRYMLPIKYAQHCQRCHPLYYDNEHFPGEVVPHGVSTATLRGFLTERYTSLALDDQALVEPAAPKRPLPGRVREEDSLTPEGRRRVSAGAATADQRLIAPVADSQEAARDAALRGEQVLFGPEALGGCRLCHVVTGSAGGKEGGTFAGQWEIAAPNVPARWMARSKFSHDSHRFASCTACHYQDSTAGPSRPVAESVATSDVLMPSIAACRSCHTEHATIPLEGVGRTSRGVAARCVDCHDYHRRENEQLSGSVFFDLPGRRKSGNDGPSLKTD